MPARPGEATCCQNPETGIARDHAVAIAPPGPEPGLRSRSSGSRPSPDVTGTRTGARAGAGRRAASGSP